jgi:metal-dependent amidase/aminoacylase/carboxypeptidase family protein
VAAPLLSRAEALGPDLVDLRRAVHRSPELGFEERATSRLVVDRLAALAPGWDAVPVAGTGLLVRSHGGTEGGGNVVIRGCLDALPVAERTGAPYASTVAGVSHACGHDGQVAMLLGAVALLAEETRSSAVALFQPAEEIDAGARAVLADESGLSARPASSASTVTPGFPPARSGSAPAPSWPPSPRSG